MSQLETNLKKTVSTHRTELLRKDEEIDHLRYQRKVNKIAPAIVEKLFPL